MAFMFESHLMMRLTPAALNTEKSAAPLCRSAGTRDVLFLMSFNTHLDAFAARVLLLFSPSFLG